MAAELITRNLALGQVVVCNGCCCGHTEKGHPPIPIEMLKAAWKKGHINRTIQLTIAGCLGPCDLPNVVQIIGEGVQEWYGRVAGEAVYEALIAWARDCHAHGQFLPRPSILARYTFERFTPSPGTANCGGCRV